MWKVREEEGKGDLVNVMNTSLILHYCYLQKNVQFCSSWLGTVLLSSNTSVWTGVKGGKCLPPLPFSILNSFDSKNIEIQVVSWKIQRGWTRIFVSQGEKTHTSQFSQHSDKNSAVRIFWSKISFFWQTFLLVLSNYIHIGSL